MAFDFPSFDKGDTDTLIESKWAKLVKKFVDRWKTAKVQITTDSTIAGTVKVTEGAITVNVNPVAGDGPFEELSLTVCVDGVTQTRKFVVRRIEAPTGV